MIDAVTMPIIGYMHSPYREKFGIPRQPNLVEVECFIEMVDPYNDLLAFDGLENFSHLWLVWQFHDNKNSDNSLNQQPKFRAQVRPPRLGGNQKIGVFATRSMYRPSPIGLSVVRYLRVEKHAKSVRLYVSGADLLNGTPILDIKPYIQYSDAIVDSVSGYAQEQPVRKLVRWMESAQSQQLLLLKQGILNKRVLGELEQVLSLDPRPAYQDDAERVYGMCFAELNIQFTVDERNVSIVNIEQTNLEI
ncbi:MULTISPECIES: tRNA (N6-threonylcarbamoyladenosine(37)-N6)-methyltransferase TrmO [Acinetobacter]|uniref:tRNA (N6-threonylcarbamoyladenosine(37)-N6)-methyltransferase TrmO n=1 Tax=Acinetobacter TaxID=469 RepID=UPI00019AE37F|nr:MULTISPECIES: tRNA (N6-threonylcarbamoyladenosine(37)-N6)-methyltransferase TrmO [Acinetobacter]EEH67420.1 methyltransferase, YaeB family [Acinetobacter sp. ATCC 27244]NAR59992.1 tRNA (N6-threonylcarbamoyladenosine(37)-N6)-methyltransferase TrmO [Acinetobacter haemolyticus]NAR68234.1 tRNA (N6-threonylcarbamoyladenosine(37)-N6)-methyltransferase TrmO [Acinetobacter haemolyticus]NAR71731.1 tRNA (N6-threonylcarbamoyladenosine(37)-N6)-methyltransferase TrmO [Acinetobacter haemolyticus]NAR84117.